MKSLPIFSLVVLLMISLCSCNNTTNDATSSFDGALSKNFQLESSGSEIFTNEEIQDAADAVIHYFSEGFSSCTMTKLRYVDSFSSNETDNWLPTMVRTKVWFSSLISPLETLRIPH